MNFLHPEFLYLAPLVAIPVLIHLLNRVRYRRVRWAAIEFLLTSERRAVRRARLRQILLLVLRTAVLAAALLALAQPLLRGGIAGALGGSSQVAVALDASASMSAGGASGSAFANAKAIGERGVLGLENGARATAGTFAANFDSPFRQPVQDHQAAAAVLHDAALTAGAGNVPAAIQAAAEQLQRGGGGGAIWILSDLQASSWWADQEGAWERAREAMRNAGRPRVVITDVAARIESDAAIAGLTVSPAILMEGDRPRLTACVTVQGGGGRVANLTLFLDEQQVDSRSVDFSAPGRVESVFHLPPLKAGRHVGRLQLQTDAMPADDTSHFLLQTTQSVPVLVVDGEPSSSAFEGAGDFLCLAVQPPMDETVAVARSPFAVKKIALSDLGKAPLREYAAIFLTGVASMEDGASALLDEYVRSGGMVCVFPCDRVDAKAWNAVRWLPAKLGAQKKAEEGKKIKVTWTSPVSPVTNLLGGEGLDRLSIDRLLELKPSADDQVLARTEAGDPFLVQAQVGKGKVYLFAVSCQQDFSNLPFTPVLLLTVHRALLGHLGETAEPVAHAAFDELHLPLPETAAKVILPDGRGASLEIKEGQAVFAQTAQAGIYRLTEGPIADKAAGTPVAAVNPPAEESSLDRVEPQTIRSLLRDFSVTFAHADGNDSDLAGARRAAAAQLGFPLAAMALLCLLGEVLLAWSIGRAGKTSETETTEQGASLAAGAK